MVSAGYRVTIRRATYLHAPVWTACVSKPVAAGVGGLRRVLLRVSRDPDMQLVPEDVFVLILAVIEAGQRTALPEIRAQREILGTRTSDTQRWRRLRRFLGAPLHDRLRKLAGLCGSV